MWPRYWATSAGTVPIMANPPGTPARADRPVTLLVSWRIEVLAASVMILSGMPAAAGLSAIARSS
ncbi:hypothetical protein ACFFX0_32830 [Citricoccus parietis]|uniref:Uncharacterized protein n=1 Tax=Citricoccus parietis TaxID=592307 RepID=A0ABV5G8K8_9MICC